MDADLARLLTLPVADRIHLAEALWTSIGRNPDLHALPLTAEQCAELDRRLQEYPEDDNPGLPVAEALAALRREICSGS